MDREGSPQIRKLGKDYYIKAEDVIAMFDYFAEDALAELLAIDEDEITEFDLGFFEGAAENLDDLSKSIKLMVTEKRLNKIKTLEDFTAEFPESKFQRNRTLTNKIEKSVLTQNKTRGLSPSSKWSIRLWKTNKLIITIT